MKLTVYKKIVFVASFVLLIAAIVLNALGLIKAESFQKAQLIANMIACLCAVAYIFLNFGKNASLFYKLFIGLIILKEAFALINMVSYESIEWYAFVLILICYTCPLILLLRQDLGRRNSIIVISTYLVVSVISFVAGMALLPVSTPDGLALSIYNGTRVILVLMLFALIIGKYIDKAERNSK